MHLCPPGDLNRYGRLLSEKPTQARFPAPDPGQEQFNTRLVALYYSNCFGPKCRREQLVNNT